MNRQVDSPGILLQQTLRIIFFVYEDHMATVTDHYKTHLAPVYIWMAGGIEHALALGASDLAGYLGRSGYAVDLGAGFGMHTIPLATSGYQVLAVDTSSYLLTELEKNCKGLEIRTVTGDLLDFAAHLPRNADLVICMGDTLTHLESKAQVDKLLHSVAEALNPDGQFVATFRNYTQLPRGEQRFIPVRSDQDRILTCFLEELPEHVLVHDVIHERHENGTWNMKVSSYKKLRLSPAALTEAVEAAGMKCTIEAGPRGMLRLRAYR
jgi:SAM-dependent methyltransferase